MSPFVCSLIGCCTHLNTNTNGHSSSNYPAISELLPNRYRSLGLASTELHILATSAFGPLMARALTKNASWRWIYILGVITGVISFAGTAIFYTPPSRPFLDRSRRDILGELDYGGIFLFTCGTTLFLLGLGWGGTTYPWASAHVLAPLIIGIVVFISTFFWDFYGPVKRPIFPYRLFKKFREFTSLLVVIFVTGLVFISINTLIPEEIAYVFTSDSIKAGIYNIPAGACGALGGTVLGGLLFKIKHVHWQIMTAVAIQSIFTALMALITPDRIAMGVVFQAFTNIPFGWILIACYVTCGLHIPQRDIGLAYGLIGGVRFLGGAIGTAIFTTVVNIDPPRRSPVASSPQLHPWVTLSIEFPDSLSLCRLGSSPSWHKCPKTSSVPLRRPSAGVTPTPSRLHGLCRYRSEWPLSWSVLLFVTLRCTSQNTPPSR